MRKEIEGLISKLETRHSIGWQEEENIGKPLYDELLSRVGAGILSANQTANALVVLSRLRHLGSTLEVFDLCASALEHRSKRVRNQATALVVGLMRIHGFASPLLTDRTIERLRSGLRMGLDSQYKKLAEDLLNTGPSAFVTLDPPKPL